METHITNLVNEKVSKIKEKKIIFLIQEKL